MNSSKPEICIRNLTKSFVANGCGVDVLKGLSMNIHAGETIAVTGASGVGKSTLLHILGTLDRPDDGQVLFRGKDVFALSDERLAEFRNQTIGFVFQFHYLLPEFSALENTMMPAIIKGLKRPEARDIAEPILVRVGLKERMDHLIGELSGGEQQRVAIARALVLKPDVVLADEPTGNLDSRNSEKLHDLIMTLNEEYNATMVVATHNRKLADKLSRCVRLADGTLCQD